MQGVNLVFDLLRRSSLGRETASNEVGCLRMLAVRTLTEDWKLFRRGRIGFYTPLLAWMVELRWVENECTGIGLFPDCPFTNDTGSARLW